MKNFIINIFNTFLGIILIIFSIPHALFAAIKALYRRDYSCFEKPMGDLLDVLEEIIEN